MEMTPKVRLERLLSGEGADRPACICPGGMMNMITRDLQEERDIYLPEAHSNARMMADLAKAVCDMGCFENLGVPFCMTVEAEAMGAGVTGENLLQMLEMRLDNIVYRLGLALLVAWAVTSNMKRRMNPVQKASRARNYAVPGSYELRHYNEVFLGTSVSRRPRSQNRQGGSHIGHSGAGHGGGGGRF